MHEVILMVAKLIDEGAKFLNEVVKFVDKLVNSSVFIKRYQFHGRTYGVSLVSKFANKCRAIHNCILRFTNR